MPGEDTQVFLSGSPQFTPLLRVIEAIVNSIRAIIETLIKIKFNFEVIPEKLYSLLGED